MAAHVEPSAFTRRRDRAYTATAGLYERAVRRLPVWRHWIERALPHVEGPRVLEVAFGTGYLLGRYADRVEAHGVDYNRRMCRVARDALARAGRRATLVRADAALLPYRASSFDTVVSTMAVSGFPDATRTVAEMLRVLRPGGALVLIDVGAAEDTRLLGRGLLILWRLAGDVIRDLAGVLEDAGLEPRSIAIGGFGSVWLHVARRPAEAAGRRSPRAPDC